MPEPSIYRQIVSAIVAQLQGISQAAGFNTNVGKVFDHDIAPSDEQSEDIVIGVEERSYQIQTDQIKLQQQYDCMFVLPISIRAFYRTTADTVEDDRRQLVDDIGRAIFTLVPAASGSGSFFFGIAAPLKPGPLTFERLSAETNASSALAGILATMTVSWLADPRDP
jgi:hypothetical protein